MASCPFDAISMEEGKPVQKKECQYWRHVEEVGQRTTCAICYQQCPQVVDSGGLEKRVFGKRSSEEEVLGVYRQALSVQTMASDIKMRAQDGGAVTGILAPLLKTGFIDGAIVMGTGASPWQPSPRVAKSRGELIECAGTKYARGSVFLGLEDSVDLYYCSRVALVGTPCQIVASRRMQFSDNHRLGDSIKLRIGLFCGHAFEYEKLFQGFVERELGIPLSEVVKFDIKRERFIIYPKRETMRELPLESVEKFAHFPCRVCPNYTAELADLSVGAAGSPLGRSTVLVRTQLGSESIDIARRFEEIDVLELEKVKPGIELLKKVAGGKRVRSAEELERLKQQHKTLPGWAVKEPAPEKPRELPIKWI